MEHTKHAVERHNNPFGWAVILFLAWVFASGFLREQPVDYEGDRVEQGQ